MDGDNKPAARCVSMRDLARSTSALIREIEDGGLLAVSRYGRIVAVIVPVPERLLVELAGGGAPVNVLLEPAAVDDQELATLELTDYERDLLKAAASTRTGYWRPDDGRDRRLDARAMFKLELEGLLDRSNGFTKITSKGVRIAKALKPVPT